MSKIKIYCDSGANIHSNREETFDTIKDFGLEEGEWEEMSTDEKEEMVKDIVFCNWLDWGWTDD